MWRKHKNARFMCSQRCNHKNDKHKRRINLFYLSVMLWRRRRAEKNWCWFYGCRTYCCTDFILIITFLVKRANLQIFRIAFEHSAATVVRFVLCCVVLSGMPHHALRYVRRHAIDKVSGHIFSAIWEPFG